MTATERKSVSEPKTDTPYLALTGELWGVYYEQTDRVITAPHCNYHHQLLLARDQVLVHTSLNWPRPRNIGLLVG